MAYDIPIKPTQGLPASLSSSVSYGPKENDHLFAERLKQSINEQKAYPSPKTATSNPSTTPTSLPSPSLNVPARSSQQQNRQTSTQEQHEAASLQRPVDNRSGKAQRHDAPVKHAHGANDVERADAETDLVPSSDDLPLDSQEAFKLRSGALASNLDAPQSQALASTAQPEDQQSMLLSGDPSAAALISLMASHRSASLDERQKPLLDKTDPQREAKPSVGARSADLSLGATLLSEGSSGARPEDLSTSGDFASSFGSTVSATTHLGQKRTSFVLTDGLEQKSPTLMGNATPAFLSPMGLIASASATATVLSMATPQEFAEGASSFATRALQDGTTQAILRVTPEALGPVEAQIQFGKQADGTVSLSMTLTLSNTHALEIAKQSVADLQQALSAAGLPQANLLLRLDIPLLGAQSNSSSQSSLHSGQQFDGSPNGSQHHHARHGTERWSTSEDDQQTPAWVSARLFDKSA